MVPDIGTTTEVICSRGPDGKPIKVSPVKEGEVMSPEECATLIMRAMENQQREGVMTLKGKVGKWLKLIAPGFVDKLARKAIERGR